MDTDDRFALAYEEHYWAVARYVARRVEVSAAADVHDAVAEVFTTAWRRRDALPEPVLPWLYGVARRVLSNESRGRRRRRSLLQRLGAQPAPAPPDESMPGAERSPALEALRRLPPGDQEVLALVGWEGLAGESLAVALGCSPAAARTRLHRARRRLRDELARDVLVPDGPRRGEPMGEEPVRDGPVGGGPVRDGAGRPRPARRDRPPVSPPPLVSPPPGPEECTA